MIVNTEKSQAIILDKRKGKAKYNFTADNNDVESTKSVTPVDIKIQIERLDSTGRIS